MFTGPFSPHFPFVPVHGPLARHFCSHFLNLPTQPASTISCGNNKTILVSFSANHDLAVSKQLYTSTKSKL